MKVLKEFSVVGQEYSGIDLVPAWLSLKDFDQAVRLQRQMNPPSLGLNAAANGNTLLLMALSDGNWQAVKRLVELGVEVNSNTPMTSYDSPRSSHIADAILRQHSLYASKAFKDRFQHSPRAIRSTSIRRVIEFTPVDFYCKVEGKMRSLFYVIIKSYNSLDWLDFAKWIFDEEIQGGGGIYLRALKASPTRHQLTYVAPRLADHSDIEFARSYAEPGVQLIRAKVRPLVSLYLPLF